MGSNGDPSVVAQLRSHDDHSELPLRRKSPAGHASGGRGASLVALRRDAILPDRVCDLPALRPPRPLPRPDPGAFGDGRAHRRWRIYQHHYLPPRRRDPRRRNDCARLFRLAWSPDGILAEPIAGVAVRNCSPRLQPSRRRRGAIFTALFSGSSGWRLALWGAGSPSASCWSRGRWPMSQGFPTPCTSSTACSRTPGLEAARAGTSTSSARCCSVRRSRSHICQRTTSNSRLPGECEISASAGRRRVKLGVLLVPQNHLALPYDDLVDAFEEGLAEQRYGCTLHDNRLGVLFVDAAELDVLQLNILAAHDA